MVDEWNSTKPIDHTKIGDVPGESRKITAKVKVVLEKEHESLSDDNAGGEHSPGACVVYVASAAPTNRPDGSTALSATAIDSGRIWYDSTYSPPMPHKWDGSAWVALDMVAVGSVSAAMVMHNTQSTYGALANACQLRAKADGSGSTKTLGYIEISHDGTSQDQKGAFRVVLNSGAEDDAPSIVSIQYNSGGIAVASSLSVLDEDDMSSDDATKVATQQSIKAFIEAQMSPAAFTSTTESVTFGNGLIFKQGYKTQSASSETVTFAAPFPTEIVNACATMFDDTPGNINENLQLDNVGSTSIVVYCGTVNHDGFYWQAWGV